MKLKVTKWNEKEGTQLEANGLIRRNTEKPEYGSLMLMSTSVEISNGFANTKNRIGFVTGTVEGLEAMIENYDLREGVDFSANVGPHRIVIREKVQSELTAEDRGWAEKINPATKQILAKDGEVIYRKVEVVAEGSDLVDTFITHDKEPVTDESKSEFTAGEKKVVKEL